ncbi:MAG: hypothetical protein GX560_06870 [Deinococcales bacterium]|nr:hypothetical protein [Deinococcales bacterium]
MPKIYLGEAIGLVLKTLPIVWVRLGSYLVLGLGLGVYAAVFFGIGWLLGQLWAPLGFVVFLVALGGAFWVVDLAGKYWFHLLRAAHTAVMTEFITTGRGPATGQLAYGRQQVMSRFADTSILFGVGLLVDGVVKFVVRTFTRIASILPVPGVDSLGKFLERVATMSTTYVDEAILSRAYAKREQNVWSVARDGVVLYAQAWKPILANAVVLALLSYAEFVLFLVLLGLPALGIAAVAPALGPALGIAALIGAWMLKLALSDAVSLAATLLAYHRATEDMEPNAEWVAKLEGASDKFRELGRKAAAAVTPAAAAAPAPATEAVSAAAGTEEAAAELT